MSQSYIEETNRTEQEKIAIITQNLLISEYFKTVFGIFPYDISRDKDGHIVVLSFEKMISMPSQSELTIKQNKSHHFMLEEFHLIHTIMIGLEKLI